MGLRVEALQAFNEDRDREKKAIEQKRTELTEHAKGLLAKRLGNDYDPRVRNVDLSRSLVTLEVDGVDFLVGMWDVYLGSFSRRLITLADLGEFLEEGV